MFCYFGFNLDKSFEPAFGSNSFLSLYDLNFQEYVQLTVERFIKHVSSTARNEGDVKRTVLVFPPLQPRGRFLIHDWLNSNNQLNLSTVSVGSGDERRTVVYQSSNLGSDDRYYTFVYPIFVQTPKHFGLFFYK